MAAVLLVAVLPSMSVGLSGVGECCAPPARRAAWQGRPQQRQARRISGSPSRLDGYDEPESLRSSTSPICRKRADTRQRWKACISPVLYRDRDAIERMFCRMKVFRRVATRFDRLAATCLAAIHIAAIGAFRLRVRILVSAAILAMPRRLCSVQIQRRNHAANQQGIARPPVLQETFQRPSSCRCFLIRSWKFEAV